MTPTVRRARPDERLAVRRVLDAAALAYGDLDARDVLVAAEGDRVLGVLLLDGAEIEAVAVRRRRRDQGVGTALVGAASERRDRLVAEFDERVRPFYASLGFDVEPIGDGRCRGVLASGASDPSVRSSDANGTGGVR